MYLSRWLFSYTFDPSVVAKFVERKCHFRSLVQRCLIALNRIPLFGTKKV